MRLVYLETPYAAATPEGIAANEAYARACMADCLRRGEAPLASHLLYTQQGILDDTISEERALGMEAGFAWATKSGAASVFYVDRGWSRGMLIGEVRAYKDGRAFESRHLPREEQTP